jgi:hypothetical protein
MLTKVIPFPATRVQRTAARVLTLSASRATLNNKPPSWPDRPLPLDSLGNMLQRLAIKRPAAVLVLESLVADMLAQLEH